LTFIFLEKGSPIVFDNDFDHLLPEELLSSLVGEAYSLCPDYLDFCKVLWSVSNFVLAEYNKLAERNKLLQEYMDTLGLNSGNSGVSPSSFLNILNLPINSQEIVESPPMPFPDLIDLAGNRYQGAQEGHESHFRKPLTEKEASKIIRYGEEFDGSASRSAARPWRGIQRMTRSLSGTNRLPELVVIKKLHIGMAYICPDCGNIHMVEAPKAVQNDILDESLLSLMGIMKGGYKISLRNIQDFFSQFLGLDLSLGKVNDSLKAISMALRPLYLEVKDKIKYERVLNIDETSFKIKMKRIYPWPTCPRTWFSLETALDPPSTWMMCWGNHLKGQ
jgi:hypothetical protein